ncbi:MAG: ABC transporter permease [Gemmatimonadales bacterium]
MDSLARDFAFALRSLRKSPAFTVTALITLALGIGASTSIFSVVNAVLLKPLPYAEPDRLVLIWSDMTKRNVRDFPIAPGDVPDLRAQAKSFSGMAGVNTFRAPIAGDNSPPEQVKVAGVTANTFAVLGVKMAFGRDFTESDGEAPPQPPPAAPGAPPVPQPQLTTMVILSNEFWKRRYGGDSSVIGRRFDIFGGRGEIVGVLKPNFALLLPPRANIEPRSDLYIANRIRFEGASRINVFLRMFGRLKPGATLVAAQQEADAIGADLRSRFTIKETAGLRLRLEGMNNDLVSDARPVMYALMGAVTFVLLIACANVANLLLVRSSLRERELTVRAAMGAGQWRLVRQMVAESLVLGLGGAALGLVVAQVGGKLLTDFAPASLPRADAIAIDGTALAFAVGASLLSAMVFGLVPAIKASRPDLADALRSTGRTWGLGGGRALRNGVVMAEVALSFVLLVGAGLMVRSVIALSRVDPGYDPRGLLTFTVGPQQLPTFGQRAAWMQTMRERLGAIPGVTGVTGAFPFPLDATLSNNARWGPLAAVNDQALFQQANAHTVQPGYFDVMKTRLIAGRAFTAADNDSASHAVIIDDQLAAKAFPGEPAVGKQILIRVRTPVAETWDIVGVVAHERHEGLVAPGREAVFFTDAIQGFGAATRWALRTNGDPATLGPLVRSAVGSLDPKLAIGEMVPMTYYTDRAMAATRFALVLLGIFAVVAVSLTAIGLYGVLATVVRQRTSEIGVRMALGATQGSIVQMIVAQGFRLSATGVGVGLVGALALTRVISGILVGVKATDPATFAAMPLLFLAVAMVASWVPARRAAALDPNVALRDE